MQVYLAPLLMTTRAPSLPKTPGSWGFGLFSLPLCLDKNPSMPEAGFPPLTSIPCIPSAGIVELWSLASCDHDPVSSSVTCMPPPFDTLRVPPLVGCDVGGAGRAVPGGGEFEGSGGGCSLAGK